MGFLYICKSAKEDGVFSNIFKKSTKLLSDAGGTSYEYKWEKKYFPGIYQNFLHIFSNNSDW